MDRYINAPISDDDAKSLRAGDYVYITGTIYTARDAAHKRMYEALERGEKLPLEMNNNIIYYILRFCKSKTTKCSLRSVKTKHTFLDKLHKRGKKQ